MYTDGDAAPDHQLPSFFGSDPSASSSQLPSFARASGSAGPSVGVGSTASGSAALAPALPYSGALGEMNATAGSGSRKKKKGRVPKSCLNCNTRKQRCDGSLPCNHCTKRKIPGQCQFPPEAKPTPRASDSGAALAGPGQTGGLSAFLPGDAMVKAGGTEMKASSGNWNQGKVPPSEAVAYFGSSFFGPTAAARIISGSSNAFADGLTSTPALSSLRTFRSELSSFSQVSQIRELLAQLPRRQMCDSLISTYFSAYNSHADVVFRPDFDEKYTTFWARSFDAGDLVNIDLRWLSLCFIMLAFGVILQHSEAGEGREGLDERESVAMGWYWAARKGIVMSPTYHGESLDTVRAGVLVTLFLINLRRAPEAWLTISFAIRFAQAQGMHVDGERWELGYQETEIRRRLWAHLYSLDRSISLFLGRPLTIVNDQSMVHPPSNVDSEELALPPNPPRPLSSPTRTTFQILHLQLCTSIGTMQNLVFALQPSSYAQVLLSDQELNAWAEALPPHFRLHDPDISLDAELPYLFSQRISLQSKYHLARLSLHRPFLLRGLVSQEFGASRAVSIEASFADLELRRIMSDADLLSRFRWLTVAGGFMSAVVLGIVLVREPLGPLADRILATVRPYLDRSKSANTQRDKLLEAEIRVLEMCLSRAEVARAAEQAAAFTVPSTLFQPPESSLRDSPQPLPPPPPPPSDVPFPPVDSSATSLFPPAPSLPWDAAIFGPAPASAFNFGLDPTSSRIPSPDWNASSLNFDDFAFPEDVNDWAPWENLVERLSGNSATGGPAQA